MSSWTGPHGSASNSRNDTQMPSTPTSSVSQSSSAHLHTPPPYPYGWATGLTGAERVDEAVGHHRIWYHQCTFLTKLRSRALANVIEPFFISRMVSGEILNGGVHVLEKNATCYVTKERRAKRWLKLRDRRDATCQVTVTRTVLVVPHSDIT
jgi:hypothetical protein